MTGAEIVLRVEGAGNALSDWWRLDDESGNSPGGCRGKTAVNPVRSLSIAASFAGLPTSICKNYWGSAASGSFAYLPGNPGPTYARIFASFSRPAETAGPMTAGVEYYVFILTLDMRHTVPDPGDPNDHVCSGCDYGACIKFESCKLIQPPGTPGGDILVTSTVGRQFASWQGGLGTICEPDPVHRATWGMLKSLYR